MFVDLGGIDGLVNYNEISYKGPVNTANYYAEGDTVSVIVLSYDKNKQHLRLSINSLNVHPFSEQAIICLSVVPLQIHIYISTNLIIEIKGCYF